MLFTPTKFPGVYVIDLEKWEDERGFFARAWCQCEFEGHGLNTRLVQCNISRNKKKGTLRGMHFQRPPYAEAKLVRCTKGAVYDVAIDLRPASPTFKHWMSVELTEDNWRMLFVPEGFAHGYQTLRDDAEVFYQLSEFYHPESASGVRWDDPTFNIVWPLSDCIISPQDRSFKMFAG